MRNSFGQGLPGAELIEGWVSPLLDFNYGIALADGDAVSLCRFHRAPVLVFNSAWGNLCYDNELLK